MLRPGDRAPEIDLHDAAGRSFSLAELRGNKNVVVFFYPKDNTLVCTREACAFRDRHAEFLELGAVVIGISDDDAVSHVRFAARWHLPYPLLSDPGGVVRKAYGSVGLLGLMKGRVTYVIDREGIIRHVISDRFRAQAHVDEALAALHAQRSA